MKVKCTNSPKSYLFNKNHSSTKVLKNNFFHLSTNYGQTNIDIKKQKTMPISINQFKKHQNKFTLVKDNQITVSEKFNIFTKRQSKISQLLKTQESLKQTKRLNSTSKSHSKKRRSKFFLNLSMKKQSTQKTFNNNYLKNVLISNTNGSLFDKQNTQRSFCHSNRSYKSLTKRPTQISNIIHNNNQPSDRYENIRTMMKKLKNLSQIKLIKSKKSQRLETSSQEWSQIEKIVQEVCKENMNDDRISQKQIECQKDMNEKINDIQYEQKQQDRVDFPQSEVEISSVQQEDNQVKTQQIEQQQIIEQKGIQKSQNKIDYTQKQTKTKINQSNLQLHKQNSENLQKFHQFNSLLLIFQHIIHNVDLIIDKITTLCQKYQIQSGIGLGLFLKQLYLNRKFIQLILSQLPFEYIYGQQVHDFTEVVEQIKEDNNVVYEILSSFCVDFNSKQNKKCLSITLPDDNSSIQLIQQMIMKQKPQYITQNLKILRKILKKISKDEKTNEKEFHLFLNYGACFINIAKVHQVIQKIIHDNLVCQYKNTQQSSQKQQMQRKEQFLYTKIRFMKMSYLLMDEKEFLKRFQDVKQHQKIESYYHFLIGELKSLESNRKQLSSCNSSQKNKTKIQKQ